MSEPLMIALVAAIPPTLTALVSLIVSLRTSSKVEAVHAEVNSKMRELLDVTASSSKAEGVLEGRQAAES